MANYAQAFAQAQQLYGGAQQVYNAYNAAVATTRKRSYPGPMVPRIPRPFRTIGVYKRTGGLYRGRPYHIGGRGTPVAELKYSDKLSEEFKLNTSVFTNAIAHFAFFGDNGFLIPEGTGVGDRDGRALKCASMQVRINCYLEANTNTVNGAIHASNKVRLLLVKDTQPNGVVADVDDVLDFTGLTSSPDRFQAFWNLKQGGRFRKIRDKVVTLQSNTDSQTLAIQGPMKTASFWMKLPMSVFYSGTTGVHTEVTNNQLILYMIPFNSDTASNQYPIIDVAARLRYRG